MHFNDYPFSVTPLSPEDGGGYLVSFQDLPGCFGDGATMEEALSDAQNAFTAWMDTARAEKRAIPKPNADAAYSGRWVIRAPKSLHRKLADQAEREGVSLNTLAIAYLSAQMGEQSTRP